MEKKTLYYLSYNLQFFAGSDSGDKTEEPTTKKLTDARDEGQVAKSQELTTGVSLSVLFLSLKVLVGYLGNKFLDVFHRYLGHLEGYASEPMDYGRAHTLVKEVLMSILVIGLPLMLASLVTAFIVNVVQVKWKVSTKPLQPKFSKFNPISGFKKMFSKDKLMELVKAIVKIVLIFYLVYNELAGDVGFLKELYTISLIEAVMLIGNIVINLGLKVSVIYLLLGFADLFYQRFKFKKDLRMSKQEVRDEYKNMEGDPQIKGRIKQKMREASQQRMMKKLPEADVVITNPTHLAVALQYDKLSNKAPIVIAKGADHLAARIREVARENHIEIVENKPLARMMYFNVELGEEIPEELYQMVAEVLAYVYKIKNS
ncbi:MAG: flagellar biosynthesis protein FlhB [bacterium]|nr:flagellar biosynthesis protein FlhB [bacterium]